MLQKQKINPRSPVASLASGPQQFTLIGDTDHGVGDIVQHIADEMPELAKAGVKRIMLETFLPPVGHPLRTRDHDKREDILRRINTVPPSISEKEIIANKALFLDSNDPNGKNGTDIAHANLFIAAMKAGIKIDFAGDERGVREVRALNNNIDQYYEYMAKHKKLEGFSQRLYDDPDYIKKLNWPDKEKRALERRIEFHRNWISMNGDEMERLATEFTEARMGERSEQERARRFVDLAAGEKTLLIFGQDHFRRTSDLDEEIAREVRRKAFFEGKPEPDRISRRIDLWTGESYKGKLENGDSTPHDKRQPADAEYFINSGKLTVSPESGLEIMGSTHPIQHPANRPISQQSFSP